MNLKRLIVTGSAVALMLGSAAPAFAGNVAIIKNNDTSATAISGSNTQGNGASVTMAHADDVTVNGNNTMTTGNAKAKAKSLIVANVNVGCGCEDEENGDSYSLDGGHRRGDLAVVKDNDTSAYAETGYNGQGNGASVERAHADDVTVGGNNTMTTGRAKAKAKSWIVVNSNVNWSF